MTLGRVTLKVTFVWVTLWVTLGWVALFNGGSGSDPGRLCLGLFVLGLPSCRVCLVGPRVWRPRPVTAVGRVGLGGFLWGPGPDCPLIVLRLAFS